MYEQFYGLREKPFNMTPDPEFLFFTEKHKEAFAHLVYGIRERRGFIEITGEVGAGKTTLCRALINEFDEDTRIALVLNPFLTEVELIRTIMEELFIDIQGETKKDLLDQLNEYLIDQHSRGRNVVVVLDEAQNLPIETLEQIRMISNLETVKAKLLQIVLVGQPELREKLSRPELRQLNQRITVRNHISCLSRQEVEDYIRHRLRIAGSAGDIVFTDEAIDEVYDYAQGLPRAINVICDHALLTGYVQETFTIDEEIVKKVRREIEGQPLGMEKPRWKMPVSLGGSSVWKGAGIGAAAAVAAVALTLGTYHLLSGTPSAADSSTGKRPVAQAPANPGTAPAVEDAAEPPKAETTDVEAKDIETKVVEADRKPSVPEVPTNTVTEPESAVAAAVAEETEPVEENTAEMETTTGAATEEDPSKVMLARARPGTEFPAGFAAEAEDIRVAPVTTKVQPPAVPSERETAEAVPAPGSDAFLAEAVKADGSEGVEGFEETEEIEEPVRLAKVEQPERVEPGLTVKGSVPAQTAELGKAQPSGPVAVGQFDADGLLRVERAQDCFDAALLTALRLWGHEEPELETAFDYLARHNPSRPGLVEHAKRDGWLAERQMRLMPVTTNLSMLKLIDLPCLMEVYGEDVYRPDFAVLVGVKENGNIELAHPLEGLLTLDRDGLEMRWFGRCYFLVPAAALPEGLVGRESTEDSIRGVQFKLRRLGYYEGDIDGTYNKATQDAVMAFQRKHRIRVDGLVGPETNLSLYSALATQETPRLSRRAASPGANLPAPAVETAETVPLETEPVAEAPRAADPLESPETATPGAGAAEAAPAVKASADELPDPVIKVQGASNDSAPGADTAAGEDEEMTVERLVSQFGQAETEKP